VNFPGGQLSTTVLKGLQTVARNSIRGRTGSAVAEFGIAGHPILLWQIAGRSVKI
jgi:hypothetical protein